MFKLFADFVLGFKLGRYWERIDAVPHGTGVIIPADPYGWWKKDTFEYFEVFYVKPYRLYCVTGEKKRVFSTVIEVHYIAVKIKGVPQHISGFDCESGTEIQFVPRNKRHITCMLRHRSEMIEI